MSRNTRRHDDNDDDDDDDDYGRNAAHADANVTSVADYHARDHEVMRDFVQHGRLPPNLPRWQWLMDAANDIILRPRPSQDASRSNAREPRPEGSGGATGGTGDVGTGPPQYDSPDYTSPDPLIRGYAALDRVEEADQDPMAHRVGLPSPSGLVRDDARSDTVRVNDAGASSSSSSSSSSPLTNDLDATQTREVERSGEARRDLERALRDYRLARRAFRNQHTAGRDNRLDTSHPDAPDNHAGPQWFSYGASAPSDLPRVTRTNAETGRLDSTLTARTSAATHNMGPGRRQTSPPPAPTAPALRAAMLSWRQNSVQNDASSSQPPDPTPGDPISRLPDHIRTDMEFVMAHGDPAESNESRSTRRRLGGLSNASSSRNAPNPTSAGDSLGVRRVNPVPIGRLSETLDRFKRTKMEETVPPIKARNTMYYVSRLGECGNDGRDALHLARRLGLDSLQESLEQGAVVDLPMSTHELPCPPKSSWLEPGVTWEGTQHGGTLATPVAAFVRGLRRMQRLVRAGRSDPLHPEPDPDLDPDEEELRAFLGHEPRYMQQASAGRENGPLRSGRTSWTDVDGLDEMEPPPPPPPPLTNPRPAERRPTGHGGGAGGLATDAPRQSPRDAPSVVAKPEDTWPVTVRLQSVDWDRMRVTGIMSAAHLWDRYRVGEPRDDVDEASATRDDSGMKSFFDGEIIDLRRHELETRKGKVGYPAGGLGVDVEYWAGIGPFKLEADKARRIKKYETACKNNGFPASEEGRRNMTADDWTQLLHTEADPASFDVIELSQDEENQILDEVMSRYILTTLQGRSEERC